MTRIILAATLDRTAVAKHLDELRDGLSRNEAIEIGCEAVEQIGLAGLQLLASAVRTAGERGLPIELLDPSSAVLATAGLAGMRAVLFPMSGASS